MKSCVCFASYRTYIYRKHRDLVLGANPSDSECFMDYTEDDDTADPAGDVAHKLPKHNVVESVSHKTEDLVSGLKRNLCLFILKVREKHCVPAVVHTSIVEDLLFVSL